MRFREEIKLHGVAVQVTGEWEPEEPETNCPAEVHVTRYEIGGVDVGNLIDAMDAYEEIDAMILKAVSEPCCA